MAIRNIRRQATNPIGAPGTPNSAPIYVDSDDNILKMIPAGSGTTEVQVIDASSTQTLTNKTLTAPVVTGQITTATTAVITTTKVIAASESGTTFFIDNATGFVTTLPVPAAGLHYTFVVITAPTSGNHTIVTNASANIIKGLQNSVAGDAGDFGTADDTISFVANNALPSDRVNVLSDGTSWFAWGISKVAAGLTFTQAS